MKTTIYIEMFIGVLCWGCAQVPQVPTAELVEKMQIEFLLPSTYGVHIADIQSKAEDDLDPNWHELPETNVSLLPVGSTLWLSYAKEENGTFGTPKLQGYVVGTNANGYNTLYPCTSSTDNEGIQTINPNEIGSPLYLEAGTYKFKMISPAYPINSHLEIQVDNGMYFYATDGRYKETSAQPISIDINATGVQYIRLNPIISQVARFQFQITKGKGVHLLEPLDQGIEISGLQNIEEKETFNWCSEHISDTLEMRYGDKRAWVALPGSELQVNNNSTITGDIAVLPTFALDYSIAFLLNIAVNGVPTQYMTLLNSMTLKHAHSYNLKWEISMEDGQINVTTWQSQSWVTDVEPINSTAT